MDITYRFEADTARVAGVRPHDLPDQHNLLPDPRTWAHIGIDTINSGTGAIVASSSIYGDNVFRVTSGTNASGGAAFGHAPGLGARTIPVTASRPHAAAVWVRGVSDYAGVPVAVYLLDQSYSNMGQFAITLTNDWQRIGWSFTTGAGSTHVYFGMQKDTSTTPAVWDASGFLVCSGVAAPLDWNDGTSVVPMWTGADADGFTDLTPYVIAEGGPLVARYGFPEAFDAGTGLYVPVAPPASLTVTLDNKDGCFTPWDSSAAFYGKLERGTIVRLRATHQSVTRTLWIGKVETLQPAPGVFGPKAVMLTASDQTAYLMSAEHTIPLSTDITVDAAIRKLWSAKPVTIWPYVSDYWVIGKTKLGAKRLYGVPPLQFDTARTTLAYAGDAAEKQRGVQPYAQIREWTEAELGPGRTFWDATRALWTFHNRWRDTLQELAATLVDDDLDLNHVDMRHGDLLVNDLELGFVPRTVGTPGSLVYAHPNVPFLMQTNQVMTIIARFTDPGNDYQRCGVIDGYAGTVDGRLTQDPASGKRVSRLMRSYDFLGDRCVIRIANEWGIPIWIHQLEVRGTPVTASERQYVRASDGASMVANDLVKKQVALVGIDNEDFAQNAANAIVKRLATARTRIATAGFIATKSDARMTQALDRRVGDRVHLTVNGHAGTYTITGVEHTILLGGDGTHLCRWALAPQDTTTYWKIGHPTYGVLGRTTRIAL